MRKIKYVAPRYAVFFFLLLPPPSLAQILSSEKITGYIKNMQ
jgi:hypothetical protein